MTPVAEPRDRFAAAAIDFLPPLILLMATHAAALPNVSLLILIGGCVWFMARDVIFRGQSPGKRWLGLQVVDGDTLDEATRSQLFLRNLEFGVPGINVVIAIAELIACVVREDAGRFGDDWAGTSVVYLTPELQARLARSQVRSAIPASLRLHVQREKEKPGAPEPPAGDDAPDS